MKRIITNFLLFTLIITMVQIPGFSVMAQTQETTTTIIDYANFDSALYDRREAYSDATGVTGAESTDGWVGYLRVKSGGVNVYRDLFCNIDISSLYGKKVEKALLYFRISGSPSVGVFKAEGDFTPGVTMKKDLPALDVKNAEHKIGFGDTSTQLDGLTYFDVTEYLNSIVKNDASKFSFALAMTVANTCSIANEKSSVSADIKSWLPYLEVTYSDNLPTVTSYPTGDISIGSPVSVVFSNKINSATVNSESVSLLKNGEVVELSNDDIAVDSGAISVSASKEPDVSYTIRLSSAIKDIYGNAVSSDGLEYSFNTIFSTATTTVQSHPTPSKTKVWAAVYDPTNLDDTGINTIYNSETLESGETINYLPRLSDGESILRDYYLKADISAYEDLNVSDVTFYFLAAGAPSFEFYKLENADFTPGTTKYGELPVAGEMFATYSDNGGTAWRKIDITEYVRELIISGETKLGLLIKQTNASQSVAITNEFYNDSKRTRFVATVEKDQFVALGSSVPGNNSENVKIDANIELTIKTADITEPPTAENIVLLNNENNEAVKLSDSDITYNPATRKLEINPSANLEKNTTYTLIVKNLVAGGIVQIKDIIISFTTEKIALEIGDIVLNEASGMASVEINVAETGLGDEMMLFVAAYDSNNCLISVASDTRKTLEIGSHTLSAQLKDFEGYNRIRVFLWQGFEEINPVR